MTQGSAALDTIVLTSSNSERKYIKNALQVLSWPNGWVVHFRYELQWVEGSLKGLLPPSDAPMPEGLKNHAVLTAYVYQERLDVPPFWSRIDLRPMRYGRLVYAHRTGEGDHDVAHFYVKLSDYWPDAEGKTLARDERLELVAAGKHVGRTNRLSQRGIRGESAARALLDAIPLNELRHQPDPADLTNWRQYYPILCFVRGIRPRDAARGSELSPEVGADNMSFVELTERRDYLFDFSFHIPAEFSKTFDRPQPGSNITLASDPDAFVSKAERTLPIESRYDEQAWLLSPTSTERTIVRELEFATSLKLRAAIADAVDLDFTIPVSIHQDRAARAKHIGAGLVGDVGVAVGTVALAIAKVAPAPEPADQGPFGLPLGGFLVAFLAYALAILSKVFAGLWKP